MPATYKDIQRLTGFSLSTISRYFNGEKLKPANRAAIEAAAEQLDFRMNDFARGLRSRKAKTVGLLIPDLKSLFSTTIMYQVGKLLREHGYGSFVCDCNMDINTEKEVVNFFISKSVDGIITIPFDPDPKYLELTRARNVPVVFINRTVLPSQLDGVMIDNFDASRLASEYLLSKGHKKTAIISHFLRHRPVSDRLTGFLSSFPESNPEYHTHVIMKPNTVDNGHLAVRELFSAPNDATALYCTNYELTLGAYAALSELDIKFPRDISFIGFDNMQLTEVIRPSMTIIEQPLEQMALEAVNLLFRRLENGASPPYEKIVLKAKLIEGESVADIRNKP